MKQRRTLKVTAFRVRTPGSAVALLLTAAASLSAECRIYLYFNCDVIARTGEVIVHGKLMMWWWTKFELKEASLTTFTDAVLRL